MAIWLSSFGALQIYNKRTKVNTRVTSERAVSAPDIHHESHRSAVPGFVMPSHKKSRNSQQINMATTFKGYNVCTPRCLNNKKRCAKSQKCPTHRRSPSNRCVMSKSCRKRLRTRAKNTRTKKTRTKNTRTKKTRTKNTRAKKTRTKKTRAKTQYDTSKVGDNEYACVIPWPKSDPPGKEQKLKSCVKGGVPKRGHKNAPRSRQECVNNCTY